LQYFAGPAEEPYLKLRKKYFFKQVYRTIDKQQTESTFLELGFDEKYCHIKFEKSGNEFDLCKKIQLK